MSALLPRNCLLFLTLLVLAPAALSSDRKKIDVIHMKNGDRITGEIQKLEYGQLYLKPPYSKGAIILDWAEVAKVESPQLFVVENEWGKQFSGTIRKNEETANRVEVATTLSPVFLPQREVVAVRQFGEGIIQRMRFKVDYGFSYTTANNQTQSTLNSSLEYRGERRWGSFSGASLFSTQATAEDVNRHQVSLSGYNLLKQSRWYAGAMADFLTSSEQQLDLRSTLGGGIGRRLRYTNRTMFHAQAGVVFNNERYGPSSTNAGRNFNSVEGFLGLNYYTFRFDSTEFRNELVAYPSFTTPGRVRIKLDSSLFFDLVGNLYLRVGILNNYDSKPPVNTPKNDLAATTSVGWSF